MISAALPSRAVAPRLAGTKFAPSKTTVAQRGAMLVSCSSRQQDDQPTLAQRLALPAAALLGTALMFAATPDDALAARSGGRVGGSGFSRRSAPMPRAPTGPSRGGGSVRNYNTYVAPPIISPYGLGGGYGYGMGGGIGFFPVFGLGSLFNIILLMFVANIVLSTIRNFTNGGGNDDKDDKWDD